MSGSHYPVRLNGALDGPKVPSLRFPEFSEEWDEKRLSDVTCSIDSGWSPLCLDRPAKPDEWGVLATTSTTWDGYSDKSNKALPLGLKPKPAMEVKHGDILVTRAGPFERVGVVAHVDTTRSKLMLSDKLIRVRVTPENDSRFVANLLGRDRFQRFLAGRKSGLAEAQVNITQEVLQKGPVITPSYSEQQKIARFLGLVNERLRLLRQRRHALLAYKNGIMQRLFSQALRFTDANDKFFPEWQQTKLGELGEFCGGGTPDTNHAANWLGDIPWISSSDISDDSIREIRITRKITQEALVSSATKIVPPNSVLIVSRVGVGKLAVSTSEVCTSQDFCNFTPHSDNVIFLAYWMVQNQKRLVALCQGTSIKGLTSVDLKDLKILLPHPDEQQKIADFLTALDRKIEAVAGQADNMKVFQRSLLQQMFA